MKKTVTVLTAIAMLFATSTFAMDGDNVTAKVAAAFKSDFSQAGKVTWEKKSEFYFASFQINAMDVDAAYNEAGELLGTSRKIALEQAPLNVSRMLSKKYEGYRYSNDVYEITFEGQTCYYLSVENEKQVLQLKCSGDGSIEVQAKTKKAPVKS